MNKDALLASVIGFGIGLLITGGVILGPRLMSQFNANKSGDVASASVQSTPEISPTPTVQSGSDQPVVIDSPKNDSTVTTSKITVSGKAPQKALVIIGSIEDEVVIETGSSDKFEGQVALKEGKNDISVVAVVNDQSTVERTTVYYDAGK